MEPNGHQVISPSARGSIARGTDSFRQYFQRSRSAYEILGVFVAATLILGIGVIAYDAVGYWKAAQGLVGIGPMAEVGFWTFRGVFTGVVFVPAAALSALLGSQSGPFTILLQNALFLGWFAAFFLPKFISSWRPVTTRFRWLAAFVVWAVMVGFAPYALVDIYAAIAVLVVLYLLRFDGRLSVLFAGVVSGIAVNLRPSVLVSVVLIAVVALVWKKWTSIFFALGIVIALIPQLVVNVFTSGEWTLWPPASTGLVALQAGYAAFVVRYDTLLDADIPQQFFCSPAMANQLQGALPSSTGQLAKTFLTNMPDSLVFSLQKISAAVQWPLSNPYNIPAPGLDQLFSLTITGITMVGLLALLRLAIKSRGTWTSSLWQNWAALAVVVLSSVVTLVGSATESRFALQLVLVGVVGCLILPMVSPREAWSRGRWWITTSLVLVIAVSFIGYTGLSHPAAPGPADQATCAALRSTP